MEAPETVQTEDSINACDGGRGPLGHPRVYLNMGDKDRVQCPYCGRLYMLKPGARRKAGGH